MKKVILVLLFFIIFTPTSFCWSIWSKKEEPVLILSSNDPSEKLSYDEKIKECSVFKTGQKIYFFIYVPEGFESQYIKYQIVKQDDKAHIGGYTRIFNYLKKVSNKHTYSDYFTLSQAGKYYIQVYNITNLHRWIVLGRFNVVE